MFSIDAYAVIIFIMSYSFGFYLFKLCGAFLKRRYQGVGDLPSVKTIAFLLINTPVFVSTGTPHAVDFYMLASWIGIPYQLFFVTGNWMERSFFFSTPFVVLVVIVYVIFKANEKKSKESGSND